ncbi:MAG TPA: hypothetical protein VGJ18_06015 [Gemmatimonadaceae bacterium]
MKRRLEVSPERTSCSCIDSYRRRRWTCQAELSSPSDTIVFHTVLARQLPLGGLNLIGIAVVDLDVRRKGGREQPIGRRRQHLAALYQSDGGPSIPVVGYPKDA